MILPTGTEKKIEHGFTLIEIIVSISILSFGLVLILQWFGHSLNILRISEDYLRATLVMESKMAGIEIKFKEGKTEFWTGDVEDVKDSKMLFTINTQVTPVECKEESKSGNELIYEDLYKIKALLSWKEGKRRGKIPIETYLINHEEKKIQAE